MYLDSIAQQGRVFLFSCGFGFSLGILYDIFVFIRSVFGNKKMLIFWQDIIYMIFCTFLTFIFSLAVNNGEVKFYLISGIIIGWLIYYFAFGLFAVVIMSASSKAFAKAHRLLFTSVRKAEKSIEAQRNKNKEKRKKKTEKSSKILLQDDNELLYNEINEIQKGRFTRKKR